MTIQAAAETLFGSVSSVLLTCEMCLILDLLLFHPGFFHQKYVVRWLSWNNLPITTYNVPVGQHASYVKLFVNTENMK